MPRQFTVREEDLQPITVRAEELSPVPAEALAEPAPPHPAALIGQQFGDLAKGALASLVQHGVSGGSVVRSALGMDPLAPNAELQSLMTVPESPAGRAGAMIEQGAEFLRLPMATKGGLAGKMTQEAIQSGALAAVQGGNPLVGAVAGAAGPLVTAGLAPAASRLAEGAERRITQALGATKERFKAMAERLAPQMLRRGVPGRLGASRASLLTLARTHAKAAGEAVDQALTASGDTAIGVQPVLDALDEAAQAFQITHRMPVREAMNRGLLDQATDVGGGMVDVRLVLDARPVQQLQDLKAVIVQLGDTATVNELVAVRRVWDDIVERAGGYAHRRGSGFGVPLAEQSEAWATQQAAHALRRHLNRSTPNLAELNREYAFWAGLRDVVTATRKRTQAQQGGLGRTILTGAGATTGALTGDTTADRIQNAALGGLAGRQLISVVTSPRWRFVSAALRNDLATAVASQSARRISHAIGRISAAMGSQATAGRLEDTP